MNSTEINYFEAVEDHFRCARGTGSFFLSPRDFAIVQAWKDGGIPLEAVLRGIDAAFEKLRRRPAHAAKVNSIAYCTQAIIAEAQIMANAGMLPDSMAEAPAPFPAADVRAFIARNVELVRKAGFEEIAASLESPELTALYADLEQLDQRLRAIEGEMIVRMCKSLTAAQFANVRQALDSELKPYRGNMSADQLAVLEQKFLNRQLLELAGLPRLSLFYL